MLIGPRTLVLVAARAMLLVVAELVVEAMVVLLVDIVLLMIVIQRMRPVSRPMMTLMIVKVLFHPSNHLAHLALNSLDTTQGALLPRLILFFKLFFTDNMINSIVDHTNSYAQEKTFSGLGSSYTFPDGSWQDVTANEIRRFIAILIHFGVVHVRGDVQKNWRTKTLSHRLWARAILSCTRHSTILAKLHVVDPAKEDPQNKLRKVESFIEDFKKLCKELYVPHKYVAIDECMVKSRHGAGFHQFIKDKPTKWGIKLWVLADSSNGYTVDFIIYIGRAAEQLSVNTGLGMMLSCISRPPTLGRDTIFLSTIFTPPLLFLNIFMVRVSLPRVQFYQEGVVSYPLYKKAKSGLRVGSVGVCAG